MFRKITIGLVAAALVVLFAGQSWADDDDDGFVGVGANFSWNNFKRPMLSYSGADVVPARSSMSFDGPNFGGALHWGITNQLVLTGTVDFGFFNHTVYPYPEKGAGDIDSFTANFWQIGVLIGAKYFFSEPEEGGVNLYLSAAVGKYFAGAGSNGKASQNRDAIKSAFYDEDNCNPFGWDTCEDDDEKMDDDDLEEEWEDFLDSDDGDDLWDDAGDDDDDAQNAIDAELKMMGKLSSPFVVQVAVGAEFFATDAFSIGADILGLRFTYASADVGKVDGTSVASGTGAWTGEQKIINLYVYSGLTMNFNLTSGAGDSGKKKDKEEDAPVDDGWGTPTGGAGGGATEDGWGSGGGWSTGPTAPTPATAPAPAPAPAPATAPPEGAPPPPPPPPPPAEAPY
jgi:hypothetical protein